MRLFIKLTLGLIFLFLLLCGGLLLCLNTPTGKKEISAQLKKRTGIECTYHTLVPTGIDQVKLTGIKALANDAFTLSSAELNLNLLKSLKKRSPVIDGISLTRPALNLEAETLISLIKASLPKPPEEQKAEKQPTPQTPPKTPPVPQQTPPQAPQEKPTPSPQTTKPPPLKPKPTEKKPFPSIQITDGEISLNSKRFKSPPLTLKGLSLVSHPEELNRSGHLSLSSTEILGEKLTLDIKLPFLLNNNQLQFPAHTFHIGKLKCQTTGRVFANPALPFQGRIGMVLEEPTELSHSFIPQIKGKLGNAQLLLEASGAATAPAATSARLQTQTSSLSMQFSDRGHHTFTSHQGEITLRQGQLVIPQFFLKSDDLSFMGNGYLRGTQSGAAIFRVVASPTWEERYTLLTNGLRLPPPAKKMETLDTPDRFLKDLHLKLSPSGRAEYQFSGEETWTDLDILIARLKGFMNQELAEE